MMHDTFTDNSRHIIVSTSESNFKNTSTVHYSTAGPNNCVQMVTQEDLCIYVGNYSKKYYIFPKVSNQEKQEENTAQSPQTKFVDAATQEPSCPKDEKKRHKMTQTLVSQEKQKRVVKTEQKGVNCKEMKKVSKKSQGCSCGCSCDDSSCESS